MKCRNCSVHAGFKPQPCKNCENKKQVCSSKTVYPDGTVVVWGDFITIRRKWSKKTLNDDELNEIALKFMRKINAEPLENILSIDECGNVIMHNIGKTDTVNMDIRYWNAGKIVIHNHPNNTPFSGTDISRLFDTECEEIMVCTESKYYSMKKGEDWNGEPGEAKAIQEEVDDLLKTLHNEAVRYAAGLNDLLDGFCIYTDGLYRISKPENMTEKEYNTLKEQAIEDKKNISACYIKQAFERIAEENNLIYNEGEL